MKSSPDSHKTANTAKHCTLCCCIAAALVLIALVVCYLVPELRRNDTTSVSTFTPPSMPTSVVLGPPHQATHPQYPTTVIEVTGGQQTITPSPNADSEVMLPGVMPPSPPVPLELIQYMVENPIGAGSIQVERRQITYIQGLATGRNPSQTCYVMPGSRLALLGTFNGQVLARYDAAKTSLTQVKDECVYGTLGFFPDGQFSNLPHY